MCQEYVCSDCSTPDWNPCDVASEAGLHGARCEFLQQTSQRHKCTTCSRVDDVINKLERLAFQELLAAAQRTGATRLGKGKNIQREHNDRGERGSSVRGCVSLQHAVKP